MVRATLTFRKPGVRPPVFVAGTFSNPAWLPQEMDWVLDDRGENRFTKEIDVEKGRGYQYKFKIGLGNDWELDWQSPTTLDNMGNTNNLLTVISTSQSEAYQQQSSARGASYSPKITPSKPATPLISRHRGTDPKKSIGDKSEPRTPPDAIGLHTSPLFAHESPGAYTLNMGDDVLDHSFSPSAKRCGFGSGVVMLPELGDLSDPTLEKFPCEKSAVINTLRRMSASTGDEPPQLDDMPSSSNPPSRRESVDSVSDSSPSPGSVSPTTSRKRDKRLSHGSFEHTKSAVSLGSIIEEPRREAAQPDTAQGTNENDATMSSIGDEKGIQSGINTKVHTTPSAQERQGSQASSVALSPRTPRNYSPEPSKAPGSQPTWQLEDNSHGEGQWRRSPSGFGNFLVEKLSWLSPNRSPDKSGVLQLFWAWAYLLWSWILGKRAAEHVQRSSRVMSEV